MLTEKQYNRILVFNKVVKYFVRQIHNDSLKGIAKYLAKILPDHCVFHQEIYYKGKLVVYIPSLCSFNPLFDMIMAEKANQKNKKYTVYVPVEKIIEVQVEADDPELVMEMAVKEVKNDPANLDWEVNWYGIEFTLWK